MAMPLNVYLIGCSKDKAASTISELETLNSAVTFVFIEAQITLIEEKEHVCNETKTKEFEIDRCTLYEYWISRYGSEAR